MAWHQDKFLGRGGFATVYLHYDKKTDLLVADKRIYVGPVDSEDANITKELKSVRNEISIMKDLNHKQIVQYIRAEWESDIFSIYMEYASGGSVANELIKNGALSEDTTKKYTLQLLEGLSYLHNKRIIHRNIKGSNILCDGNGNIKLAGFGNAKRMDLLHTLTSKASKNTAKKGTVCWMAPEVIKADHYGRRADIWSTGATVVEMLTAHPPWYELEPFAALFKIANLEKGGYALDSKISRDAEDFLTQTFVLEEQRPRAHQLLQHSWLRAVYVLESEEKTDSEAEDSLTDVQKHEEDKFLGKGAFGSVYLHHDKKTNAWVAVKRMVVGPVESEDATITKNLKAVYNEIYVMKDLNHKGIVQYIRAEQESNIFSIYMEYVSGGSVAGKLRKNGALSEDATRRYTLQILEGLLYLHCRGIIHRDVKGSNILCNDNGNIKLADFGISRQMYQLTLAGYASKNTSMKGSPYWMAPEVIRADKYGTRADIWSTGATVVEMLTTHPPWHQLECYQVMFKIGSFEKGGYVLDSKISRDAEDFLTQTFKVEEQRPRADELLQHSWLKAVDASVNVEWMAPTELKDGASNVEMDILKSQMAEMVEKLRLKDIEHEQERLALANQVRDLQNAMPPLTFSPYKNLNLVQRNQGQTIDSLDDGITASVNVEMTTPAELDVRPMVVKDGASNVELKTLKRKMDPQTVEIEEKLRLKDIEHEQERQVSANVEKTTPAELDVRSEVGKDGEIHESSGSSASSEGSDRGSGGDLHGSDQINTSP